MLLMKAKVIPVNKHEFLQYLVDGNLEQVRIKGFEALVELGFLSDAGVLKFLLGCLSTDPSPFVRNRLFEVFVYGLAGIAFAEGKPKIEPVKLEPQNEGGLLVDNDVQINNAEKLAEIARKTTIEGAMAALKEELKDNEVLKTALWKAVGSGNLSLSEQLDLLDICSVMYDANERLPVKLQKPRFWTVKKTGKVCYLLTQFFVPLMLIKLRVPYISRKMALSVSDLSSRSLSPSHYLFCRLQAFQLLNLHP